MIFVFQIFKTCQKSSAISPFHSVEKNSHNIYRDRKLIGMLNNTETKKQIVYDILKQKCQK